MSEKEIYEELLIKQGTEIKKLRSDKIKLQKELKEYKNVVENINELICEVLFRYNEIRYEEAKDFIGDSIDDLNKIKELLDTLERKIV